MARRRLAVALLLMLFLPQAHLASRVRLASTLVEEEVVAPSSLAWELSLTRSQPRLKKSCSCSTSTRSAATGRAMRTTPGSGSPRHRENCEQENGPRIFQH